MINNKFFLLGIHLSYHVRTIIKIGKQHYTNFRKQKNKVLGIFLSKLASFDIIVEEESSLTIKARKPQREIKFGKTLGISSTIFHYFKDLHICTRADWKKTPFFLT